MIQIKSQPLTKEVKKLYLKLKAFKGLPKTKQSTCTKFIDEELILILISNLNPPKTIF